MKKLYVLALLFFATMSANAQFKVNSNGRVSIGTITSDSKPKLYVETSGSTAYDTNIGVAAQTVAQQGKKNIAIEGNYTPNQSYTTDSNFGVLGFANLNHNHGRNFGISGILSFNNSYTYQGGAGVYGADYGYLFSYPDNIQGIYAGYFHGQTYLFGRTTALEIYTPADARLCENVESIGESNRDGIQTLDNLLKMNVLEFNMKNSQEVKAPDSKEMTEEERQAYEYMKKDEEELFSRRHFGLSAQELQEIYPNLVLKGQDGFLCINYQELVPILIRSIQELNEKVAVFEGSDNVVKQLSRGVPSTVTAAAGVSGNMLYQNSPNPFKEKTVIRFRLADDAQNAAICIYDLTGKQLKKLPISSGETSVSVNGWELGEGMFLYTLLVNGQEIDTKRMIITK